MGSKLFVPLIASTLLLLSACGDNNAGGGQIQCNAGGGQYTATQATCPTPAPTVAPGIPLHVYNVSYLGAFIGGGPNVTAAQINANVSVAENGSVGTGAGRPISVCSHQAIATFWLGCVSMQYIDMMRPDAGVPSSLGAVIQNAPGFVECGATTGWLQHVTGTPCATTSRVQVVPPTIYALNFGALASATWTAACIQGALPAQTGSSSCNNTSPDNGGGDPHIGLSMDNGDLMYEDTPSTTLFALTQCCTSTKEIGIDPALKGLETTWYPLAFVHANASKYRVWNNGANRGVNDNVLKPHGACLFTTQNCLDVASLPQVECINMEFMDQNQLNPGHIDQLGIWPEFFPFHTNSATDIIANGNCIEETQEFESGVIDQHLHMVGTTALNMLFYYATYLLTYNPNNPTAEADWLDVDSHVCGTNGNNNTNPGLLCEGQTGPFAGQTVESQNRLSSWRVQTIVPTGIAAIPVQAYSPGIGIVSGTPFAGCTNSGPSANCFGIDGCANHTDPSGESDSGGVIPFLIPLSCALTDNSDNNNLWAGVYGNGFSGCAVAGTPMGGVHGCIALVNASASPFVVPCSFVTALGADLVLQGFAGGILWTTIGFHHQADIGQSAAVLQDILPSDGIAGGGTMTTATLGFTCGTTQIAADSGMIITP